jgi:hypothetical protein
MPPATSIRFAVRSAARTSSAYEATLSMRRSDKVFKTPPASGGVELTSGLRELRAALAGTCADEAAEQKQEGGNECSPHLFSLFVEGGPAHVSPYPEIAAELGIEVPFDGEHAD